MQEHDVREKFLCLRPQMLKERFREFARETESIGQERVAGANEICDQLIAAGHSDSAIIAQWKDQLNEAWTDLLELIDTRTQMLQASWELHKFYYDCKDLLERIAVSVVRVMGKNKFCHTRFFFLLRGQELSFFDYL